MKKVSIIIAIFALAVSILSSCKSHEQCPAYGQADTDQTEENV